MSKGKNIILLTVIATLVLLIGSIMLVGITDTTFSLACAGIFLGLAVKISTNILTVLGVGAIILLFILNPTILLMSVLFTCDIAFILHLLFILENTNDFVG